MTKRIAMMMVVAMIATSIYAVPVKAEGTAAAASGASVAIQATEKGVEQYIIKDIQGRSGAATIKGAKGIVNEKITMIQRNISNAFKGMKTSYTKNSTAKCVDLVTKTKSGKVAERIQCKDTPKSISRVVKQVDSGKYNSAQLVGTKETAEAFNKAAETKGIKKVMKSNHISTKETQRIAEKALGKQSMKSMAQSASKAGAIGAVLGGGFSLVESIKNGDDLADTTGNVTYSSIESYASGAVASLAGDAATTIIVIAGGSSTVTVLVPIAVAAGAGVITYMVFENVDKNYDIRGMIADATDYVKTGAVEFVDEAKVVIPLMTSDAKDATCVWFRETTDATGMMLSDAAEYVENAAGVVTVKAAELKNQVID